MNSSLHLLREHKVQCGKYSFSPYRSYRASRSSNYTDLCERHVRDEYFLFQRSHPLSVTF
jgi:hypothetical protein